MKSLLLGMLVFLSTSVLAQTKPGYSVAEITFLDKAGYQAELFPKVRQLLAESGAEIIVAGGKTQAVLGAHETADSVTIVKFASFAIAQAFYASERYQVLRRESEKYIRINLFLVEGE